MQCCRPHVRSASECFSRLARRYRRRFERRGLEASQRQLVQGLAETGFDAKTLLEVGCGVGHLHQTLLERGAATAQGVDLAAAMIDEAQRWAQERGLASRVEYFVGDVVDLRAQLSPAQICILDKVVCCYPDAYSLLQASLDNTEELLALSYPRDRWYIRVGAAMGAAFFRLIGSAFRPYVHSPQAVARQCQAAGLHKVYEARTLIWLTEVYRRA